MTAAELLAALRDARFAPGVGGTELVFTADPPDALTGPLEVLRSGLVAAIAGRNWWGCDSRTGRSVLLDPKQRIPHNVGLLGVEGEAGWDRIDPQAFLDFPELFTESNDTKPPRSRRRAKSPSGV